MTVLVAYKWAANPQDASVGADGSIDWGRAKYAVSEYDPAAIEVGRQLADQLGTELVGLSVGLAAAGAPLAKKAALSRGLDKAIVVADDATASWNPTQVGAALAKLVEQAGDAQVLLTGDSSVDEGSRVMSALVAGALGWPVFQEVTKVAVAGDQVTFDQVTPTGTRTITVTGPVVLAVTSDAATVKTPGMKDILAAGKKPLQNVDVSSLGVNDVDYTVDSAAKAPAPQRKQQVFSGDSAAADLVAALKADGVL